MYTLTPSQHPRLPLSKWTRENPQSNPLHSPIIVVNLPRPGAHGDLALDGVDAVADGGQNDEEDDYYDRDGDVALDHCGGFRYRVVSIDFFSLLSVDGVGWWVVKR